MQQTPPSTISTNNTITQQHDAATQLQQQQQQQRAASFAYNNDYHNKIHQQNHHVQQQQSQLQSVPDVNHHQWIEKDFMRSLSSPVDAFNDNNSMLLHAQQQQPPINFVDPSMLAAFYQQHQQQSTHFSPPSATNPAGLVHFMAPPNSLALNYFHQHHLPQLLLNSPHLFQQQQPSALLNNPQYLQRGAALSPAPPSSMYGAVIAATNDHDHCMHSTETVLLTQKKTEDIIAKIGQLSVQIQQLAVDASDLCFNSDNNLLQRATNKLRLAEMALAQLRATIVESAVVDNNQHPSSNTHHQPSPPASWTMQQTSVCAHERQASVARCEQSQPQSNPFGSVFFSCTSPSPPPPPMSSSISSSSVLVVSSISINSGSGSGSSCNGPIDNNFHNNFHSQHVAPIVVPEITAGDANDGTTMRESAEPIVLCESNSNSSSSRIAEFSENWIETTTAEVLDADIVETVNFRWFECCIDAPDDIFISNAKLPLSQPNKKTQPPQQRQPQQRAPLVLAPSISPITLADHLLTTIGIAPSCSTKIIHDEASDRRALERSNKCWLVRQLKLTKLELKGLSLQTKACDIRNFFESQYGAVTTCRVNKPPDSETTTTTGMVQMLSIENVIRILQYTGPHVILGRTIQVDVLDIEHMPRPEENMLREKFQPEPGHAPRFTLLISNIPNELSYEQIHRILQQQGKLAGRAVILPDALHMQSEERNGGFALCKYVSATVDKRLLKQGYLEFGSNLLVVKPF